MAFRAILWEEWIVFKRKFKQITASALISPLMYMLAFGLGFGNEVTVNGLPYIYFIVPGIIALSTMNTSYSAVAVLLNIHRLYDKTFEQYIIAPIPVYFLALGKITAGMLRGMYSGVIIIAIARCFGVSINITPMFILVMVINGLTFASLGFFAALIVNSHADMNRFSTFVITPMTFICGTFFSIENLPHIVKGFIDILPLTQVSSALRDIAAGNAVNPRHVIVIFMYFIVLFLLSVRSCYKVNA